jgi:hypothetical protein
MRVLVEDCFIYGRSVAASKSERAGDLPQRSAASSEINSPCQRRSHVFSE